MRRLLLVCLLTALPLSAQTFSPPAGTYSGTQTVTITPPSGKTCFYTVDGTTPYLASKQYTAPITVSATTTLNVICAVAPVVYQNTETSSAHWKCTIPTAQTYGSLSCQTGGGVGSINPSNIVWTWGTPMSEQVSTTSSTGTTQALLINTQSSSACTTCTQLTQDKVVTVDKGKTFLLNNEMDSNINMLATYNQFHTASLQCNQQGSPQWQYDNQQGGWKNFPTPITYGCPLALSPTQTEIRYTIHWVNGDTSCGGFSTDHYDSLTVCVGGTNGVGGVCHDYPQTGLTLCGYTEPGFSQSIVIQDQPDLTNTTTSGSNPTTATRKVWNNNMTASMFGTSVTGSATYTIGAGSTGRTKITGASKFTGSVKL
jgi:hypothetical protein